MAEQTRTQTFSERPHQWPQPTAFPEASDERQTSAMIKPRAPGQEEGAEDRNGRGHRAQGSCRRAPRNTPSAAVMPGCSMDQQAPDWKSAALEN